MNNATSKEKNNNALELTNTNMNPSKSILHVIQIPIQKNNLNSPERAGQNSQINKNTYNTNKIVNSKGLNIIPIKSNLNMINNNYNTNLNKDDNKLEKLSPKLFTTSKISCLNNNFNSNLSPKNGIVTQNSKIVTSNTKNLNELRLPNDVKASYKSPSPSRGTNTTTTRYLKKSPDIRK